MEASILQNELNCIRYTINAMTQQLRAKERYARLEGEDEFGPDDDKAVCEVCGVVCTRKYCFFAVALFVMYIAFAMAGVTMWFLYGKLNKLPAEWLVGENRSVAVV